MPYSLLEAKPIEELCKVVDCEHKTAPYVDESEYLVVRTSNVRDGQLVMESMKYTTLEGYNEWTSRAVPEHGDVLFTREAPAGESCLVPSDTKVCMGQRMVMLRPHKSEVDPVFLSMILNTERTKNDIYRLSIGSTVSRINIADIKKLKVASPPLPEQQKIAKILSTWDKAISTTERLIENSTQQKKALMQQLLTGKKRLLDESGKRFEGEWEEVSIGSTSKCFSGGTPSRTKDEYYNGSIPWITSGKLNDRFVDSVNEYITELGLQNSSAKIVKNGSILVAMYGATAGKVALNTLDSATVNQAVLALEPKEKFHNLFLFYLLEVEMLKALLLVQGGQPNLSATIIKAIKIKVPALLEQQKIATVLTNADKEIELLEQQLADLQQEKKALMQVLLTGKKRVVVDGEGA